ncbi:MAG TPA: acyl-CoA dehydrogenase family protein [Acidimicrobiales bacterium]|nr:acyl-CoA dehydrogenase family protein [Acidimicrobiales bacterium]
MSDGPSADEVRAEVRAWLSGHWDPERPLAEWRADLADSGWGCPTWPRPHGRGLPAPLGRVVADELRAAGAVGPAIGVGMSLAAPTLLAHGSDDLQRRLLRRIVTGEDTWCQLFSEPGNGSDLAGLTTHARRDGDEWAVSGQKVWTTGAHHAAYGMLLARTDWDVPKHRGISFFAFPMRQPGVEVRPLRQMNGRASFNEVFLDDARVPHANVVGEVNGGWAVALTTLAHERGLAAGLFGALPPPGGGRTRDEATAEATAYLRTYEWYPQRAGRADLVPTRARAEGLGADPLVRQLVSHVAATERTARLTADRAAAARRAGRPPGPEGSIGKLAASRIAREAAAAHGHIAGAHGMLTGPGSPEGGIVAEVLVSVPGASIAGGTDEIQHNIIGERVLGLPKEPSVDADRPFRDVEVNRRG